MGIILSIAFLTCVVLLSSSRLTSILALAGLFRLIGLLYVKNALTFIGISIRAVYVSVILIFFTLLRFVVHLPKDKLTSTKNKGLKVFIAIIRTAMMSEHSWLKLKSDTTQFGTHHIEDVHTLLSASYIQHSTAVNLGLWFTQYQPDLLLRLGVGLFLARLLIVHFFKNINNDDS